MNEIDIKSKLSDLKTHGITVLENQFSNEECDEYILEFEKIIEKFKKNKVKLNNFCQMIKNPYRHNIKFADLIYNKNVDVLLKELIDKDYILVNSTLVNRSVDKTFNGDGGNMGDTWHTDSHYVGGKRLDKGFTYIAVILFDDFSKKNGSTLYIPDSHLRRDIPKRQGYENEQKQMIAKRGSIIVFDGGIWHKGGPPSNYRRWSMFTYYGPWFVKPYYRFPEMLGEDFGKKTSKELRRLFHYNSTPPLNEDERENTVTKEY